MRKFSMKPVAPQAPQLSVEEEAILMDEQNESMMDLEQAASDNDQLGDIIVTMGDVQTVASNTPEIGTVEQDLISSVADMAVAGSDANPEELVQGMLPSDGMSSEGFVQTAKDTLARLWETIKATLVKMWEHVKNFFRNIRDFFVGPKRQLEKLKKLIDENKLSGSVTLNDKAVYRGSPELLLVGGDRSKNIVTDYKIVVNESSKLCSALWEGSDDILSSLGGLGIYSQYAQGIKNSANTVAFWCEGLAETVHLKKGDERFDSSDHKLLGGMYFKGYFPYIDEESKDTGNQVLKKLMGLKLEVLTVESSKNAKITIPLSGNLNDIHSIIQETETWLKMVETKSRLVDKLDSKAKQSREVIENAVKGFESRGGITADKTEEMRHRIALNSKINNLMAGTLMKVVNQTTRVTSAVLNYAIQSCEACVQTQGDNLGKPQVAT